MKARGTGTWPPFLGGVGYKQAVLARFGQSPYDDAVADRMGMTPTGSVETCQDRFDALLVGVDLTLSHAIRCFLDGLQAKIQNKIRMFKSQGLRDAYCLAKLYKQKS